VTLVWVVHHSLWGAIGLPVRAALYVRKKDLGTIPPDYEWKFRTKLEMAVALMQWLKIWLEHKGKPIWMLMDGAYAKQVVLRAAKKLSITIVSRLRHDSALRTLPDAKRPKGTRPQAEIWQEPDQSGQGAGAKKGWTTEKIEPTANFDVTYKTFLRRGLRQAV
jgi:hypothetical protein